MNDNSVGIEKMRERVRKQIEHDEPVLMTDDASDAVDPDLMTKEVFGVVKAQNTVMVGIQSTLHDPRIVSAYRHWGP